jgi:hypothetical protein
VEAVLHGTPKPLTRSLIGPEAARSWLRLTGSR